MNHDTNQATTLVTSQTMGNGAYPWHKNILASIQNALHAQALPHAILLQGNVGIGKRVLAQELARMIVCPRHAIECDCASCVWAVAGTHPDLHYIQAPKINEVRAIGTFLAQKSARRVVCIDNAGHMTRQAQNALLKMLEEPANGAYILLVKDTGDLLGTVLSRVVAPNIMPNEDALHGYTNADDALAFESGNAPLLAKTLADTPWWGLRQTWLSTHYVLATDRRDFMRAYNYWQEALPVQDFLRLSFSMGLELMRKALGLGQLHGDVDIKYIPNFENLHAWLEELYACQQGLSNNVRPSLIYRTMLANLANLR